MASILVIGDIHCTNRSIRIVQKLHPELVRVANETKPDLIVVLGDVMHDFANAKTPMLTKSVAILRDLSLISKVVLLIGNHELTNKTVFLSGVHPFTALYYWGDNMVVADTCCKEIIVNGLLFAALPYVPNGRFNEALETMNGGFKGKNIRAIFAHQEFKGADINKIPSTDGDAWPLDAPLIIAGHIHKRHMPQKNIIYIGTPYQENFSEMDEKSISLFKFTEDDYTEKRIFLNLPRRVEISIKASKVESWQPPENSLVKLTIIGRSAENAALRKLGIVKKLEALDVSVIFEDIENAQDAITDDIKSEVYTELAIKFSDAVAELIEKKKYLHKIHAEIMTE